MSNHHPKWKILTWNEKICRNHVVNDESKNVDSNAFQKELDQKRSTSPSITIFSEFW